MPRLSIIQTNFTAGEIAPTLYGRVDIDRYNNAAKKLENAFPLAHGGAVRRDGTLFIHNALNNDKKSRLIDFVINKDLAYLLELSNMQIRVFDSSGNVVYENLASPYFDSMLDEIDFTNSADTMFLFHPDVPVQKLKKLTGNNFSITPASFIMKPIGELGYTYPVSLVPSAKTSTDTTFNAVGEGVPAAFLPSDLGRVLVTPAGSGKITQVISFSSIKAEITATTLGQYISAWSLDSSPQTKLFTNIQTVSQDSNITLSGVEVGNTINIAADAPAFSAMHVGYSLAWSVHVGTCAITKFISPTLVEALVTTAFGGGYIPAGQWAISNASLITTGTGIVGSIISLTFELAGWRATDVGKYVRVNGGVARIESFISQTNVTAKVISEIRSGTPANALEWSLEEEVWSYDQGYPRTGTFFQQRLWCAGTKKQPQTIWGSRTALYYDFTDGTADSDACTFTISSDEINPISYLSSAKNMLIHTYGGEFSMSGNGAPITPSNIQIEQHTNHGCKGVRPLTIGSESVFVQRSGWKIRAMAYLFQKDGYESPEITTLASHITKSGIVAMAYQKEPNGVAWIVLSDGTLVSCTLNREQQVAGFARHYTDGAFESVVSVPTMVDGTIKDRVFFVIRRTVSGSTLRTIEHFDDEFKPLYSLWIPDVYPPRTDELQYGCTVDSGTVYESMEGVDTFINLLRFEGKLVHIVADGYPMQPQTVVNGQITINRTSKKTLIGLPFKSTITMLNPEVSTAIGTAQGNSMSTRELTLRFHKTLGARVIDGEGVDQDVPFRNLEKSLLDRTPELYSGLVRVEMLGWERGESEITIVQDQPLPMHLLSATRKLTVNS